MSMNESLNSTEAKKAGTFVEPAPLENSSSHFSSIAYTEISEPPPVEVDVLEQLKANIHQLEDLSGRINYMISEIKHLVRK